MPNNGDGREGRGAPAGPEALLPEASQGPRGMEKSLGMGDWWSRI